MRVPGPLQELRHVVRGTTRVHVDFRSRIAAVIAFSVVVDIVCGVLAYYLERGHAGSEVHNLWQALFWTTTQLLTVSSQIKNPVSTGGHILDVVMEAYAVSVVAALGGSFAAFFHGRSQAKARA
jgi:hypothetical protein